MANYVSDRASSWPYNINIGWPTSWGLDYVLAVQWFNFKSIGRKQIYSNSSALNLYYLDMNNLKNTPYQVIPILYVFADNSHLIAHDGNADSYTYDKIYYVNDWDGNPVKTKFAPYYWEGDETKPVCVYNDGRIMRIYLETGIMMDKYALSKDNDSISVEPYQPINEELFSCSVGIERYFINSVQCLKMVGPIETKYSDLDELSKDFAVTGYPESGYLDDEGMSVEVSACISGDSKISWAVNSTSWKKKTYEIKETAKAQDIPFYAGVPIASDFASCFKLECTLLNSYKTIEQTVKTSLSLSDITIKTSGKGADDGIYSEGDSLSFSYAYAGVGSIDFADSGIKAYAPSSDWLVSCSASESDFELGDTISVSNVKKHIETQSYLASNGKYVPLGSLSKTSSIKAEIGGKKYSEGESFTADNANYVSFSYSIKSDYLSDRSSEIKAYITGQDENYITSCRLSGENTALKAWNDSLSLGDGAKIEFLNSSGNVVKTRSISETGAIAAYPEGYDGEIGSRFMRDAKNSLSFTVSPYEGRTMRLEWVFTVDYYEQTLKKRNYPAKLIYYVGGDYGENPSIEKTGLEAYAILHANSEELGKTYEEDIDDSLISFSNLNTDFSGKTSYQAVSFDAYKGSQHLTGSVYMTVAKYGIDSFEVIGSDSKKYWDSGKDTFHHPDGVTYKYVYTDGTAEEQSDDGTLRFYRSLDSDGNPTGRLDETSEIKKSDGASLYVVPEKKDLLGETLVGECAISFKKDSITSVTLPDKMTFCLGDRLSKRKSEADVLAYYESGVSATLAQGDWYFSYSSPVLEERTVTIQVGTDSFDLPSDMVVWEIPTPYLSMDSSSFQKNYMNKADKIDATVLGVTLRYKTSEGADCDYSETLSFTKEAFASKGLYSVSSAALPDYVFDGYDTLELDLSDDGFKDAVLSIKAYDTISKGEFEDKSVTVRVTEILEIIGVSIRNPKMSYSVGDRFLENDDQTIVRVFYKDGAGNTKPYDALLSDELTALNVYPPKGTKFKTIQNSRTVTVSSVTNSSVYATYDISVTQRQSTSETNVHNVSAVWLEDGWGGLPAAYYLVDKKNTKIDASTGERILGDGISEEEIEVYGYLSDLNDSSVNAKVIMFDNYIPPIEGSNNVTVTFPCYEKGNADIVNKSHFGIFFGNNNARNRLFISGNPDYPNMDWRSGETDYDDYLDESMQSGNFAYFEDTSSATYGETDNAIVGYDIVSNDKLLVLKGHSDKETTVYFRTPTLVTAINGSGTAVTDIDGNALYQDEFSLSKGNNSVAGVSPKGILNFNGDTVFISDDSHLMGLDLTGIVGDNQRYANPRSYYIDEDLRAEDMDGSFLWTDNTYLLMVLKDKIYVAHYEMKSETQYEWWPIDVSGVTSLLKIKDVIYMGTSDGRLCRFNKKYYYDIPKVFAGVGEAKVSEDDDKERIIVSKDVISQLEDGKEYVFDIMSQKGVSEENSSIYCKWATIGNSDTEDCDFQIIQDNRYGYLRAVCRSGGKADDSRKKALLSDIGESVPVYLNHLSQGGTQIESAPGSPLKNAYGKAYYLRLIEDSVINDALSDNAYALYDSDGNQAAVSTLYRAMLCKRVEQAWVDEIDREDCTFSLKANGETLDLVRYHNQPITNQFTCEIREYVPVEAYLITKPYTMGKLEYLKTVWSMTLSNDTNIPSELELCLVSNKMLTENTKTLSKISKDALGLDMSEFSFESVDFEKNVTPRTYSRNRVITNLKFLTLGIRNYSGTNCVLSSMSLTYTFPYKSYGD